MAATASSTLCLLLFASATVLQAQARVALLTGAQAAASQHHHQQHRQLQQYTGGTVTRVAQDPCASRPCSTNGQCVPNGVTFVCSCLAGWAGDLCQQPTAMASTAQVAPSSYQLSGPVGGPSNPADGAMRQALASGNAPDDIAKFNSRAWLKGRVLGQRVNADGMARGSVGHNELGGITGVAEASGQFESDGRFGTYSGSGHARAAAASAMQSYATPGGGTTTVLQGAAGAQASGQFYGQGPGGRGPSIEAYGSANADAQGTVILRQPGGNGVY